MSETAPAFSFYAKDFLLGTVTLSLGERGAYITLLAYQWDNGSVPDDAAARWRILGGSRRDADKAWTVVRDKFQQGDAGSWRNSRLEKERLKQVERRTALAANGQKGAARRWTLDDGLSHDKTMANVMARPLANTSQDDGLPSPSPSPFPEEQIQDCGVQQQGSVVQQVIADYKAKHPRNRGRFY